MWAIISFTPWRSAAAAMASASSSVVAMGFSSRMCLPAAAASSTARRCRGSGEAMSTASTSPRSSRGPWSGYTSTGSDWSGSRSGPFTAGSQAATTRTPVSWEKARACSCPMKPAPMMPIPIRSFMRCLLFRTLRPAASSASHYRRPAAAGKGTRRGARGRL